MQVVAIAAFTEVSADVVGGGNAGLTEVRIRLTEQTNVRGSGGGARV